MLTKSNKYTRHFYATHHETSHRSASHTLSYLFDNFEISSVLDVGCGSGAWITAAMNLLDSPARFCGIDGPWARNFNIDTPYSFNEIDLTQPFSLGESFDLTISMEVAEHLPSSCANDFVNSLTQHSNLILFSAAIKGQGGTDHINEQSQSYWSRLFSNVDFDSHIFLRNDLWNNTDIGYWYRQNVVCFSRIGTTENKHCQLLDQSARTTPLMDIAHPECLTARKNGKFETIGKQIDYFIWRTKGIFK